MKINGKVEGLRKIQKNLKKLDGKVERKIARSAVGKAGTILLKAARAKAPVGTGAVKKSLTKRSRHRAKDDFYSVLISVRSGVFRSSRSARRRGVGAEYQPDETIRYYRFLELGTKYHAAQPFLQPVIDQSGSAAVEKLKSELGKQIEIAAAEG